uniref:Uncharacterized protein n=1 Tax=Rhizophora mucronata TaxID=61149 RepID=A0A2P2Q0L6_RHIMU
MVNYHMDTDFLAGFLNVIMTQGVPFPRLYGGVRSYPCF